MDSLTVEINKIGLRWNDDKIMQSIDSIETYTYGTKKYLVSEKVEIESNNVTKGYKSWLTLKMLLKKT